jgi:rhodanese-related sulfurtransferase
MMTILPKFMVATAMLVSTLSMTSVAQAENKPVAITKGMSAVTIMHEGSNVELMRVQDNANMITQDFALTSRPCPPFCIQPMVFAPGVDTLGELEVIDYLVRMQADENILVIDSRTPNWVAKGTIPGAVNISWVSLTPAKGATTEGIMDVMLNQMDVALIGDVDEFEVDEAIVNGTVSDVFDYSNAKTLVLFCNGMWCGQSPASMKTLLAFGYPASKIKWFRGGMQTWQALGLTTVK